MFAKNPVARRIIPNPTALTFVVSLFALIVAGLQKSSGLQLALSALAVPVFVGALVKIFRRTNFAAPQFFNGSVRQLAWIRIIVCLTAFVLTFIEDLPATAQLPLNFRWDYGFFHLLNNVSRYRAFLLNPHLLAILQWTTAILLFLGVVGWKTRANLLLGALGFLLMQ